MPRHLVEFDPVDWIDVPTPGDFGADQHRYVELRQRSAWARARHAWLVEHGLVER